jgi:predicted TIM-barrel fold metal-dependent hydrolase
MLQETLFISAVDHVIEPPALWTERMSQSKFGQRIPHVARSASGADCWSVDGREFALADLADVGALVSNRVATAKRWDDMPKAAYDPAARLKAMDDDGVAYSVLYPSLAGFSGERFGALSDSELSLACVQAYNDWLIDEWSCLSKRFIPQCIVPLSPIDATVAEIRRAVGRGHRGVIFPAAPMQFAARPDHGSGARRRDASDNPIGQRSVRADQYSFLAHPAALSRAQIHFCRQHHRLGHLSA